MSTSMPSIVPPETSNSLTVTSLFPPAEDECEIQLEQITETPRSKKRRSDELNEKHIQIISDRSTLMSIKD